MAHVLVFPYPNQGHINPMLQFSKRLASKGPTTTLLTTHFIINTVQPHAGPVRLAAISDGHDNGGFGSASSLEAYLDRFDQVGSRTLSELIEERRRSGCPFTCMVYDTFVPWAARVAMQHRLPVVAFSTQSCAVSSVYYYVNEGMLDVPAAGDTAFIAGLPPMERSEFPSFTLKDGLYPTLAKFALSQFNLEKVDWVLFNSFDELEGEVVTCLKSHWHAKTVGPCVPLTSIDVHAADATIAYGINLLDAEQDVCMKWLSTKPTASVVYVSFGSFASLGPKQMQELASALKDCNKSFLWVVRSTEERDLPGDFLENLPEVNGLVVKWSPQLDVLAHEAVGCFITHCGWNSTLEALSSGVPMVAIGLWTDQPTNAKYIEQVWGVGVRVKAGEGGVFMKEEIVRCVKEVMEGEKGEEIKRNAKKWKELAKEAVSEGGSSDENLNEFVEYVNAKAEKYWMDLDKESTGSDAKKPSEVVD
ncbi:indole-3-acetate beta-glucosyltransferase-like [Typha angustifolia]|uniref:indole-3-acetate beta-glucosyltransferase-like n=1 Tax=Typha angustifolia TaxID=59011 RepID=UPI003C2E65BD